MDARAIPLGPLDLLAPIGAGGMGRVWRGRHRESGLEVAVKVLSPELAQDPRAARAWQQEARAAAALAHPHIITLYDLVEASAQTEGASGGAIPARSPALVMELAGGGTLSTTPPLEWRQARGWLLALLDALAHAHARGVIHRDVKPGNVLFREDGRLLLADFGMARLSGAHPAEGPRGGTPAYMAPEQLSGEEQGPWTDLYALGCLGWALLAGAPPFAGSAGEPEALSRLLHAHLRQPPPPLVPRFPTPDGAEPWLRALLAKDPADRFGWAADAARALEELPEIPEASRRRSPSGPGGPLAAETTFLELKALPQPAAPTRPLPSFEPRSWPAPAFPEGWRRPADAAAPLEAGGLGLAGLRPVPLVGREALRDRLWALLRRAAGGRASAAVLRGVAGVGKSRLAEWLGERAHELGVARAWRASHHPEASAEDGLSPMIARGIGAWGLSGEPLAERVARWLRRRQDYDRRSVGRIVQLLAPAAGQAPAWRRPIDPDARFELTRRALAPRAGERACIVWIDDAQWALDALGFAQWLLETDPGARVLFVLTVQEEALAQRPIEAQAVETLAGHPAAERLDVGPLDAGEREALVAAILGLEGGLAREVAERTGGIPIFAVQLVTDWAQRGLLDPHPAGFRLRPGVPLALPDSLHEVWASRIVALLAPRPDRQRIALELAAALGAEVDLDEWRELCARQRLGAPADLVDALVDARLARLEPDRNRWSFVHPMLRESIERLSAEAGRRSAHHRACAELLEPGGGGPATRQERAARHWAAAGELDRALGLYLAAGRAYEQSGRHASAIAALDARERAFDELDPEQADPRRIEGWLVLGRSLMSRSLSAGHPLVRRAFERIDERTPAALRAEILAEWGTMVRREGRAAEARRFLEEAVSIADTADRSDISAFAQWCLGLLLVDLGDLAEATVAFTQALADYGDDVEGQAACHHGLARVARRSGRPDGALRHYRRAGPLFARAGLSYRVQLCLLEEAELALERGQPAEALRLVDSDEDLRRGEHAPLALWRQYVLARIHLADGDVQIALGLLRRVVPLFQREGRPHSTAACQMDLLLCLAHAGDWAEWDATLAQMERDLSGRSLVDPATLRAALRAAAEAQERGQPERAARAAAAALRFAPALSRTPEAEALRAWLRASR